jgi:hypothetical protein
MKHEPDGEDIFMAKCGFQLVCITASLIINLVDLNIAKKPSEHWVTISSVLLVFHSCGGLIS